MDCCFNKFIPHPTNDTLVARPAGKTYINGMSEAFVLEYDAEKLNGLLTKSEFEGILDKINEAIINEYPCPGC
jgi:hypothetical protein